MAISDGTEFEGLEELFFQLSEYGKRLNVSKTLETNEEVRRGYIQGLQHIINGGSIQDIVAEMNLCQDVGDLDKAFGYCKALDYVTRYVTNSIEILRMNNILGKETSYKFYVELNNKLNNNISL